MAEVLVECVYQEEAREEATWLERSLGEQLSSAVCSDRTRRCAHGLAVKLGSEQSVAPPTCTGASGHGQHDLQQPALLKDDSHPLCSFFS